MYLNPTMAQIAELKAQNPDVIRIIVTADNSIAVANGLGTSYKSIKRHFKVYGIDLALLKKGELWDVDIKKWTSPSEFCENLQNFITAYFA